MVVFPVGGATKSNAEDAGKSSAGVLFKMSIKFAATSEVTVLTGASKWSLPVKLKKDAVIVKHSQSSQRTHLWAGHK